MKNSLHYSLISQFLFEQYGVLMYEKALYKGLEIDERGLKHIYSVEFKGVPEYPGHVKIITERIEIR